MKISDNKRIAGKFMNSFIFSGRVVADKTGCIRVPITLKIIFESKIGGVEITSKTNNESGDESGKVKTERDTFVLMLAFNLPAF